MKTITEHKITAYDKNQKCRSVLSTSQTKKDALKSLSFWKLKNIKGDFGLSDFGIELYVNFCKVNTQ